MAVKHQVARKRQGSSVTRQPNRGQRNCGRASVHPVVGTTGGAEEPLSKFRVFVEAFLKSDVVHRLRGSILETAAALEFDINEALAAWLSFNVSTSDELVMNVFPRLPVKDRIDMLDRRMKDTRADERWPLLVPVLRRVFDLRNRYAHGWVTSRRDGGVRIVSWNRGRESVAEYNPENLMWLAYEATIARTDLARLWAFWVSSEAAWHEVADESYADPGAE